MNWRHYVCKNGYIIFVTDTFFATLLKLSYSVYVFVWDPSLRKARNFKKISDTCHQPVLMQIDSFRALWNSDFY